MAERLRMTTSNVRSAYGPSVLRALGLHSIGHESGDFYTLDSVARLADLVDPDCDDGRYEGVHTARPVDREALLALTDEMGLFARTVPYQSAGKRVATFARRIRECCGEAS